MGTDKDDDLPDVSGFHHHPSHPIRHISGIYIRNLTPFPHRDRVMSSLDSGVLTSSQNAGLSVADDLDIMLARKRARRISTASVATFLSRRSEEIPVRSASPDLDGTIRATAGGRSLAGSASSRPGFRAASPLPGFNRGHSASNATSVLEQFPLADGHNTSTSSLSQRNLEHVIASRLFETFVTLSAVSKPSSPQLSRDRTLSSASRLRRVPERSLSPSPSSSNTSGGPPSTPRHPIGSPSRVATRSPSTSTQRPNGRFRNHASSDSILRSAPSKSQLPTTHSGIKSNVSTASADLPSSVPFYVSPLHAPSTNPSWLDIKPRDDFSHDADLRGRIIQATLWARGIPISVLEKSSITCDKGKGREVSEHDSGWKVLRRWEIDLDNLQPFSPDFTSTSEELPPNSIVFSMYPSGMLFFVPPKDFYSKSRSPSPEHNVSDGELDVLASRTRVKRKRTFAAQQVTWEAQRISLGEIRMREGAKLPDTTRLLKLQTSAGEATQTTDEVIATIDNLVHDEGLLALARESEQLATSLRRLQGEKAATIRACDTEKDTIFGRRALLEKRREDLRGAMYFNDDDIASVTARQEEIDKGRAHVAASKASLVTQRAHVVRALEHIYPIEPLSPPDLLFTILSIPLPVPTSPSDPAPPLSHPRWPSVNEDSTATALGYTAQVILALSAYLNTMLPYPVVCAGSRSVIKDPISTMHGPRTFPLYSKGVDTYRFEYAVFLLNKNIEMLMTQQGLQTLDMRHTLPNLKNLLLTLTSSLEDEELDRTTRRNVQDAEDTTSADTDTSVCMPHDDPPRKALFAPISGFWLSRSGSNATRTSNGLSAPPSSSSTPETRASEQSGVAADVLPSEPDVPADHPALPDDRDKIKPSNGHATAHKVNGLPVDSNTATSDESAAETVDASVDDGGDTETIKDGAIGRVAAQGSWITKAFFGQIDRDRDREKSAHGAGVRRKRSTVATTTAATAGARDVGRTNDTIVR